MNKLNKDIQKVIDDLVVSYEYISIDDLLPHEKILEDRLYGLLEYIKSLSPYIIVPSILVCADSNVIIDGHHRYYALKKLGKNNVPVVRIKYDSDVIITGLNNKSLNKSEILQVAKQGNVLEPKSTEHHFVVNGIHLPLILLSKLMLVE